jgi:hypothetical protein
MELSPSTQASLFFSHMGGDEGSSSCFGQRVYLYGACIKLTFAPHRSLHDTNPLMVYFVVLRSSAFSHRYNEAYFLLPLSKDPPWATEATEATEIYPSSLAVLVADYPLWLPQAGLFG